MRSVFTQCQQAQLEHIIGQGPVSAMFGSCGKRRSCQRMRNLQIRAALHDDWRSNTVARSQSKLRREPSTAARRPRPPEVADLPAAWGGRHDAHRQARAPPLPPLSVARPAHASRAWYARRSPWQVPRRLQLSFARRPPLSLGRCNEAICGSNCLFRVDES